MSRNRSICKTQLIFKILTRALIVAVIITVAFVLFCPRPTIARTFSTRITLTYSPPEIVPGGTVTINGTLEYHEDPWEPFPNQNVNLYYAEVESEEWNPIGTATTNTQGQYQYIWTVNLPLGEYKIKATYEGDEGYRSCETTTLLVSRGLLVIPESQNGPIATLTCTLVALTIMMRRKQSP